MGEGLYGRGTCSALVITCSDFRFKTAERTFAEAAGLADDYDLIARPGAIRPLVAPRNAASKDSMEDEILLLWRIHRFSRVVMANHESCRAYDDLVSGGEERRVHDAHLRAAKRAVELLLEGVAAEGHIVAVGGRVSRIV